MTIVETLKIVLKTAEYGMTSKEAYDEIIRRIVKSPFAGDERTDLPCVYAGIRVR